MVDLWACLPRQLLAVARLVQEIGPRPLAALRAGVPLARGTQIDARLVVPGAKVEPAGAAIVWAGTPANAGFLVTPLGPPHGGGPLAACMHLAVAGVPLLEMHFELGLLEPDAQAALPLPVQCAVRTHRYRSAFASYASEDRAEMAARVQGMRAVAPELDIFVDVTNLRAGDDWQARIEHELASRDKLLLFWSHHAAASRWVDFEWRSAARLKGTQAIAPVPLDDPRDAPPPPELAHLHFGDPMLALTRQEALRERAQPPAAAP